MKALDIAKSIAVILAALAFLVNYTWSAVERGYLEKLRLAQALQTCQAEKGVK